MKNYFAGFLLGIKDRYQLSKKEYEAFGSRSDAFNGAMTALEDDNVNVIGVYGMGGVGKTILIREAARQVKEKKLFDEVVFVAVTQTPNMLNIQDEIVEKLGLKIEERSVDALGIPSIDDHKGCKILMTSRRQEVLKSIGSQKVLPIELLEEDEAWKLFKNVAGPIAERSDLQPTAEKVTQKCARLPIAIATVAKALKHKENLYEWKDALEMELSSDVNSAIKMS
ncbi:hypothetical protein J1N35_022943 [Gossypium stocksii]|uniref:NB-ARC domain-containing protein n=1 Tax=Gossypium stocksii TaxID=47602 RepID=A0A9D4A382_9ROSI|nr:hypothetical protein J1N35_022943 [Gossypium stocksii]